MITFIYFFIYVNYLSSRAFSISSTTGRTPIEEDWMNGFTSVSGENNLKILLGRNLSQAVPNSIPISYKIPQLNHDIKKRSLRNFYGKKRPYHPLHRKRKYATKFTGLTNFVFDGIIDFDQKRSLPSKSPLSYKIVNSLDKDPNNYNTDTLHQEKPQNSEDKNTHEQYSDNIPVVNSVKSGLVKTTTINPLNKEPYYADKSSYEHHIPSTKKHNENIPNLDLINANRNFYELKLIPQASETDPLSPKKENHSNETILSNEFLNSPEYEKALMLRKTNKVEMLINNQNLIKDMVKYALGKGVYPALVALEGDDTNDQVIYQESGAKENAKPFMNYDQPPSENNLRKFQSPENQYSKDKNEFRNGPTINQPQYYHHNFDSQERPLYNKPGTTNKNINMNRQFENNGQPPIAIKNEMVPNVNKVQNVENEKSYGLYSDNQLPVPKGGGTDIGQEHRGKEFPGSHPYSGGNKAATPKGTYSHNLGQQAPFQEFEEKKMNVGRVHQIVLLKTEPVEYNENPNNEEENPNEEKAKNYEIPESVHQFQQVRPNNKVETAQKPQSDVKNAWTKPYHPHSSQSGHQPISQSGISEPKGIHIPETRPEEPPENNSNNYKIEDLSEKKIKTSQEITEYVMKEPENLPEQKTPPSLHKPDLEESDLKGSNPKKTKLTKTFFAEEGGSPKNLPEGGVALFGNLTEVEFLPLSNKNVSRTILIREETEYVMDKGPTTMPPHQKTATLADYSAYNPPVVNPREQEDQTLDPTMMRMHVRPFKKKVPLLQENFRKRRFGIYHSPDQEDRKVIILPMRAEVRRVRRQIDGSEASCCYNGGTCITDGEHKKSCLCLPAYTGQFCETAVDECLKAEKICKEHEVCADHNGQFSCSCAPNFVKEGDDCIPAVTCEEFPCLNGGECQDTVDGGFICICELGFIGRTCSKRVPECEDSSCSNEEICVSTEIGYKCVRKTEIDKKL